MFNKFICGAGAFCLILVGCKQPQCPEKNIPCPENPISIDLKDCSPHLQNLIQNHKSDIRGFKVGAPLSGINEVDSNFGEKNSFYVNYNPDLDINFNYWAEVNYYFDENKNVDEVETEIIPGGLTPEESDSLFWDLYFEMQEYLSGKYGPAVRNTDYKLIWNRINDNDSSLTIFSLYYNIPDEDFSIYINDKTGKADTISNPPTVKYIVTRTK